jgi:beta-xylosidase
MPTRSITIFTLLATAAFFPSALADRIARPAWDTPHAANPILPGYYADPSLVQHNGQNYLYATLDPWGDRTLGCWQSADFKNWTYRPLNWPTKAACTSPTSGGSMVWAPSVVRAANGKFYMYVSVGSEVWVGTADQPLGPWADANGGKPLIPGNYKPGFHMIDAEAFVDEDGSTYLYWGSGWNWKNGHCFAVKLKPDMVTFEGEPRDVTPGNYFEGPFMFKHAGRYYLSYSQGVTVADTYQVHYAIGDSPLGPFTEATNSPILITDQSRNIVSPGHHAMFTRDGHDYIIYHRHSVPYVKDQAFRQTCVDELHFTTDGLIEKVRPTHTGPPLAHRYEPTRLYATATASSELDALHNAARVLDDNNATRWTPAVATKGGWLQLDLLDAKHVDHVEFYLEYAWKPYRFALEASNDAITWTSVADHQTDGVSGSPLTITVNREWRYLRLIYPNDPKAGPLSVWEFAAYPTKHPQR